MSFQNFDLHPSLLRAVTDLGFESPTAIQRQGLPPALAGRDVLACAATGSGKTATFLLPMIQRLMGARRGTTRGLVIAPTRELAAQIVDHFNDLARHTRLRAMAVHGGVSMGPQEQAFRRGVDVLVACPGRLLDHLGRPYANLDGVEVLVLDEADRMLDMGFLPDVRRILKRLPPRDQTLLFSATLPAPIVTLARELLRDPAVLNIERPAAPAAGVRHSIYPIRDDLKRTLLLELLRRDEIVNALVFTRTKHRANRLAQFLDHHGVACERIHGNRTQAQRTRALDGFKRGRYRVLVATDVAARGIDIVALSHVVNFDVPKIPDDYIHRVGRTARAGATGEAFTFVSHQELGELRQIERAVKKSLPRRRLEGFDYQEARAVA
jgi:ATP-dependent RNA helicase RhlE